MALTKRSDVIVPELLTEAIQGEFEGATLLWGTGAAAVSFTLPTHGPTGARLRGGDTIEVPYFGTIGEMDDVAAEGDALTPTKITMSDESATVSHSGKAVEITHWAQMAANYADPYAEMARQMRVVVERRADKALYDVAVASLPAANVHDISTSLIDYDAIVDAKYLWGDEQDDIVLMAVHSEVAKNMRKLKDSTGRPLLVDPVEGGLPRFYGMPIAISDRHTLTGAVYTSLLLKRNALAFWAQEAPRTLTDTDILADTEIAAVHLYWVAHRYLRTPGGTKPGVVQIKSAG